MSERRPQQMAQQKGSPLRRALKVRTVAEQASRVVAKPEHCLPKTQRRQGCEGRGLSVGCWRWGGIARRWNLFLGGVHIRFGYGRGLGLVIGGRHASYRANPGRSLLLLPALRCALFGDVFAAIEERYVVTMIVAQNV